MVSLYWTFLSHSSKSIYDQCLMFHWISKTSVYWKLFVTSLCLYNLKQKLMNSSSISFEAFILVILKMIYIVKTYLCLSAITANCCRSSEISCSLVSLRRVWCCAQMSHSGSGSLQVMQCLVASASIVSRQHGMHKTLSSALFFSLLMKIKVWALIHKMSEMLGLKQKQIQLMDGCIKG